MNIRSITSSPVLPRSSALMAFYDFPGRALGSPAHLQRDRVDASRRFVIEPRESRARFPQPRSWRCCSSSYTTFDESSEVSCRITQVPDSQGAVSASLVSSWGRQARSKLCRSRRRVWRERQPTSRAVAALEHAASQTVTRPPARTPAGCILQTCPDHPSSAA
jgi:hypothetical protein